MPLYLALLKKVSKKPDVSKVEILMRFVQINSKNINKKNPAFKNGIFDKLKFISLFPVLHF